MDNRTPAQRSYNMSRVKSKNTALERKLMKALREKGIWFTHHRADVFGKPDIVFKRKKIAVFIDSGFWHGRKPLPETNKEFWGKKISRNIERDNEVNAKLSEQGWIVIRLDEGEIKKDRLDKQNRLCISRKYRAYCFYSQIVYILHYQ
jgi:DNA mismatch endonuclease (patch repair protein)